MTTANDPLKSIQSRIDELEETISDRGEQIRARANQLKEELQEELSPMELIRKHPVESAGISFVTGLLTGRAVRGLISPRKPKAAKKAVTPSEPVTKKVTIPTELPPLKVALGSIGIELLNTGKDLAITWVKNRVESKIRKQA